MKIAGYLRVSTDRQAEEGRFGLDAQRAAIVEYCQQNGHEVVAWYSDEGISGAKLEERPGLMQMIEDAEKKRPRPFEGVIAAKGDRLSRDAGAQWWIESKLTKQKVAIIYLDQNEVVNGTEDYMKIAFRQFMGVVAQMERGMIAARLKSGRKAKAARGGYAGGRPPFGYKGEMGQRTLEVDGEKVGIIIRIFELHAQGLSLREIAAKLNEEGYVTSEGAQWQHKQVGRVIKRRDIYEGQYVYAGVTAIGQHEAILK